MERYPRLDELRAAIRAAGYRQEAFAQLLGYRPDYFSHILAGRKPPKPELLKLAAAYLRRSEADLRPSDVRESEEDLTPA